MLTLKIKSRIFMNVSVKDDVLVLNYSCTMPWRCMGCGIIAPPFLTSTLVGE
jgi:hypothetical protein